MWALLIALDRLPWPWGEDALAWLFAAAAMVKPSQRRRVMAWAAAHDPEHSLRLALAVSAFRGRWIARSRLLGVRSPAELRPRVVVEGLDRLTSLPAGAIVLVFHLGPPHVDVALALSGTRVRYIGGRHDRIALAAWWNDAWRPLMTASPLSSAAGDATRWPAVLYSARQTLLAGGTISIMADSAIGRELFRIPLPGTPMIVRGGWLTLHQLTGAPVIPVLTRLDGRTQVVSIHPPLPKGDDLPACRDILASLVLDHVRRFPEQCPDAAFKPREQDVE